MPLHIIRSTDPLPMTTLVVTVYGQPGIGKTSLAFTAERPLMLDFDHGAHRSAFRKDSVRVDTWSDVANLTPEDLAGYKTIVLDTAGRALDAITAHIGRTQPKLTSASGNLTLQGYGELKAVFLAWLKRVRQLGMDVVILAHDSEDKSGDDIIVRPDIQGGSKSELYKASDAIGYMYRPQRGQTVLDFNPSDRWIGKNCADLNPVPVPDFRERPDFFASVVQDMKDRVNQLTDEQKAAVAAVDAAREAYAGIDSVDGINAAVDALTTDGKNNPVLPQLKRLLAHRATELGLEWDRDARQYQVVAP